MRTYSKRSIRRAIKRMEAARADLVLRAEKCPNHWTRMSLCDEAFGIIIAMEILADEIKSQDRKPEGKP